MAVINNSMAEIAELLKASDDILIFTHLNMDGDAAGSSAALCHALRASGKNCYVLFDTGIAENLKFLDKGVSSQDPDIIKEPGLTICVDASETKRFPETAWKFNQGKVKLCIDHHLIDSSVCDYNYIDPEAAATAELIYKLILELGVPVGKDIAEALFAGIATDTGNFTFSNTTKESHEIAAALYDSGFDAAAACIAIYENNSFAKLKLNALAIERAEMLCGGRLAISAVTQEMLKETGALMDDSEGIASDLRSIAGVEVSVLVKEKEPGSVSVSFRSKNDMDVSEIAAGFNGGGHRKAAGCTIDAEFEKAYESVKTACVDAFAR